MDPVQWAFFIIQIAGDLSKLGIFVWLLTGGWKFVLRTIGFDIDTLLVSFIGRIYEYFMQVLTGTMFNEKVISELLQNVYVFVGVIMFFRLMMLVIKYLINPDLVSDAKAGVNSLVQRVIIGLAGILFIPTLFDFAMQLQAHIMQDNIIQQIVVPKDMLKEVESKVDKGGQYIGTYVLAGFISPGENASKKTRTEYENALENGDLSSLSTLRKDGWLVGEYEYDYFFLLSTFCLCYVLYLMVKYTLDVITRFFRMLMYQMLAPIAMIEYMINGSDNGVFKTWKQGVLGTYFMLFVRVLALWFVVFVMVLMAADNEYSAGTLLATDDYLLRALIIMALLGFMMDLPKLIGQVFGLDLEQEGNATGMLKQVGGMLKGAAMGGLAVTGAAVGGAIGTGKAALGQTKLGKNYNQFKKDNAAKHPGLAAIGAATNAWGGGMLTGLMGTNSITGGLQKGYSGQKQEQDKAASESKSLSKANETEKREKMQNQVIEAQHLSMDIDVDDNDTVINAKPKVGLDSSTMSAIAGMMAASNASGQQGSSNNQNNQNKNNSQDNQVAEAGKTTIEVNDIEVKVTGKAVANYDGGLETNITGKAVTTYNGDLETNITGNATASYNKDLEVEVGGNTTASYKGGLDVTIDGPATAKYNKDLNVEVDGNATAKYNKDLNVEVDGNATAKYNKDLNVEVDGNATAKYNKDLNVEVDGNATAIYNKDLDIQVGGRASARMDQDVDITVGGPANVRINTDIGKSVPRHLDEGSDWDA